MELSDLLFGRASESRFNGRYRSDRLSVYQSLNAVAIIIASGCPALKMHSRSGAIFLRLPKLSA